MTALHRQDPSNTSAITAKLQSLLFQGETDVSSMLTETSSIFDKMTYPNFEAFTPDLAFLFRQEQSCLIPPFAFKPEP